MGRIAKAYETLFRAKLQQVGARRLEKGVQWLMSKAQKLGERDGISFPVALSRIYEDLASRQVFRRKNHKGAPTRFLCDAGLGGLARWLRAAGYEALWRSNISDEEVLKEAQEKSATILTTDSMLMERRLLRDAIIPALWLPPAFGIQRQLGSVFNEFGLQLREPRCMACGGELLVGDKEALRERIPPKTYRWIDHYFVCKDCGQLFWHGTHWQRIIRTLESAIGVRALSSSRPSVLT